MTSVLFTNVRIIDGTGDAAYPGEVLVQGNRIARVARGVRAIQMAGTTVVDAAGATLMPGMTEAHTHFSWNDQPSLGAIQRMPTEEHILWCAHIAKRYLDRGWTSCVGAATAKPRLDVVIRNAVESGPPDTASTSASAFFQSANRRFASAAETAASSAVDALLLTIDALPHLGGSSRILARHLTERRASRFLLLQRRQRLPKPQQRIRRLG